MKTLTTEQLETIRQAKGRVEPKELARQLGLPKRQVEDALKKVRVPVWEGREAGIAIGVAGVLLILLLGWLGYRGTTEHYDFHFDDTHAIVTNDAIKLLHDKVKVDTRTDLTGRQRLDRFLTMLEPTAVAIADYNFFRMVTYWSFALTYYDHPFDRGSFAEQKEARAGWHAANNRIHYLNGLLAFWLAYLTLTAPVFRRSRRSTIYPAAVALLAAVVFTTHPLQTQAVTYLVQRTESLCATFYLLALALYATARHRAFRDVLAGDPADVPTARWLSPVVALAAGLFAGGGLFAVRSAALDVGGYQALVGLTVAGAVAALVWIVKTGRDDWVHAASSAGAFVAFGLAAQTKEIGATIPVAVILWELFFVGRAPEAERAARAEPPGGAEPGPSTAAGAASRRPWIAWVWRGGLRERARVLGPWVALLAALIVVGALFARQVVATLLFAETERGTTTAETLTPVTYSLTQLKVVTTYLRMFVAPFGLHLDHDYPTATTGGHVFLALVSGLALLGAVGLALWRGARGRVAAFALLVGLVVLAPTSSFLVLPDVIYEHRFYLPLFGAALTAAVVAERLLRAALPREDQALWAVLGLTVLLGGGLAAATSARNAVWKSEVSLWRDVTAKAPGNARAWVNLGLAYAESEPFRYRVLDPEGNEGPLFGQAVELPDGSHAVVPTRSEKTNDPPIGVPPGGLKQTEALEGGPALAAEAYERALDADPDYTKALNNLALATIALGRVRWVEADLCARMAEFYRGRKPAIRAAAAARAPEARAEALVHFDRAKAALERTVELKPDDTLALSNLGNLHAKFYEDPATGIDYVERSLEAGGPAEGWLVCGEMALQLGVEAWGEAKADGADDEAAWRAARPSWRRSRRAYELFLRRGDARSSLGARARTKLDQVEGLLEREVTPVDLFSPDEAAGGDGHDHGRAPGAGQAPPR